MRLPSLRASLRIYNGFARRYTSQYRFRLGNVARTVQSRSHPLIPRGYLDKIAASYTPELRWMLQKLQLQQDILLLGCATSQTVRRRLALALAELLQRPVEILSLHRDTTESCLKQQRQLDQDSITFVDQAVVRAAKAGHLLLLLNLEYAERNILPLLNNLLENREMNLDDGSYLGGGEIPVHPDFGVIGVYNHGASLDPPVRSRFQMKRIDERHSTLPQNLEAFGQIALLQNLGTSALERSARLLQLFPRSERSVLERSYPVSELEPILEELHDVPDTTYSLLSPAIGRSVTLEPSDGGTPVTVDLPFALERPSYFVETMESTKALSEMVQEFAAGRHVLLVSPRGTGKSALAQWWSEQSYSFPLYADMTAPELLQSRATTTTFRDSPLTLAARRGGLCVLDGVDKLRPDALDYLQRLLVDRIVDSVPCHENFRVLALAQTPVRSTLNLATIVLEPPSDASIRRIVPNVDRLLHVDWPLSLRNLLRIAKRTDTRQGVRDAALAELLSSNQRATLESALDEAGLVEEEQDETSIACQLSDDAVEIGGVSFARRNATTPRLVPRPKFFDIPSHLSMIRNLLSEYQNGERSFLLLGNQGTGKNKVCDRLCQLAGFEREYIQLHRDSTVGSLTLTPSLESSQIVWKDSPLVRAVIHGRALVIDEADKAPLEVVAVLKSLVADGELLLSDGRRIVRHARNNDESVWVLANRPGRLFHGNDFFCEIGDCFSAHVVPNPDLESEMTLLRSYAPRVKDRTLRQLAKCFAELRSLFDAGDLSYPYSTREAVAVAKHLDAFPDDDLVEVLHNVLDFDSFDPDMYETLRKVFRSHGISMVTYDVYRERIDASRQSTELVIEGVDDRSQEGQSHSPPGLSSPKFGKWDDKNEAHVGGNQWAGGTGGSDTAGLGGRGGPYRLDRGHKVHQVSDEAKAQVSEEAKATARRIAEKELQKRLKEIQMSGNEYEMYENFLQPIRTDVRNLHSSLKAMELRSNDRGWVKRQAHGDLDDSKLIDGVAGDKYIYKRRGKVDTANGPKCHRLRFVVDCSGSMYRFNGYDERLNRCLQAAAMVMESFEGLSDKFDYSIVGHSGDSSKIELVPFGKPASDPQKRLEVLQTMVAHSQFCDSGDFTLDAIRRAVDDAQPESQDDRAIVIAISDANMERYGIQPKDLQRAMKSETETKAFCVFIASFGGEAEMIKKSLPTGRGFVCLDSSKLPGIVRNIVVDEMGK